MKIHRSIFSSMLLALCGTDVYGVSQLTVEDKRVTCKKCRRKMKSTRLR